MEHPIIGLAGGVGAGKSTVARILQELGAFVVNSDELGRAALRDQQIRDELVRWWGERILDDRGEVDRSAVAHIVFEDSRERAKLEARTHPWIESRRRELFTAAPPETRALVIDAPLLFEVGLDRECDAVIFVETPRETRLARVARDRGWSEAELARREESQGPLDEKRRRADYVVSNAGDLSELTAQVREALESILQSRRSKS